MPNKSMEEFLDKLSKKINGYRKSLEKEGFSGEDLEKKVIEKFNAVSLEYYKEIMTLMSEADYQLYKRSVDRKDKEGIQSVMKKYKDQLAPLREEMLNNF